MRNIHMFAGKCKNDYAEKLQFLDNVKNTMIQSNLC